MKRKRKNHRRQSIIMLGGSVMVLTALTVTGLYVNENKKLPKEDYAVELTQLDENKEDEVAYEDANKSGKDSVNVSSTDIRDEKRWEAPKDIWTQEDTTSEEESEEVFFDLIAPKEEELSFSEEEKLLWPIVGNVLIPYDMEKPVYFATLDQYKLSPAIVIQATEGENIHSAARGKVTKIEKTPELGNVITMDLGSGYEIIYGQLTNLQVKEGDLVEKETYIGDVAAPTKYYSVEGDSVYFGLKKDGEPINPMTKLQ